MSMPAPVYSLSPDAHQEAVDFLRRLSNMLTGGRNAEMLQEAAGLIETLSRRTTATEQLLGEQQEENARNLELREVAELASDNLMAENEALKQQSAAEADVLRNEMASLKDQFAAELAALQEKSVNEKEQLAAEITLLTTQLDDARRQVEIDRNWFAEETLRAQAAAELAQEQHAAVHAELEELRSHPRPRRSTIRSRSSRWSRCSSPAPSSIISPADLPAAEMWCRRPSARSAPVRSTRRWPAAIEAVQGQNASRDLRPKTARTRPLV